MPSPLAYQKKQNIAPKSTVFQLWVLNTACKIIGNEIYEAPRYPDCPATRDDLGLYTTLENAEKAMKEYEKFNDDIIIGFKVLEIGLDLPLDNTWPVTERTYNHKREKIDEILINQNWEECFKGRPEEKIRFKVGDFVEYFDYNRLLLCIVAEVPPSPEDFEDEDDLGDASDDAYILLSVHDTDTFHEDTTPCDLFEPREPIPDDVKEYLRGRLDMYMEKKAEFEFCELPKEPIPVADL